MDQRITSEYFKRSYFALDGLWFMMIENEFSFDKALDIDEAVWRILPKIQARKVKELLGLDGRGLEDFLKAIKVKLEAEEYDYEIKEQGNSHLQIAVYKCPWYEILKKANREHLAPKIANRICFVELQAWVKEFGDDLEFDLNPGCCMGKGICLMEFRRGDRKDE